MGVIPDPLTETGFFPLREIKAKQSPPTPVDPGSITDCTADAAIAASAVLSVVEPNATGIGGDCFAIVAPNGKHPISYNGSGINPEKANLKYFEKNNINSIGLESPHSVTIPGSVHAWATIHSDYGKLHMKNLKQYHFHNVYHSQTNQFQYNFFHHLHHFHHLYTR